MIKINRNLFIFVFIFEKMCYVQKNFGNTGLNEHLNCFDYVLYLIKVNFKLNFFDFY